MVDFREEKKIWNKGYQVVAGLDEAGRGPLAGPVVAAAVAIAVAKFKIQNACLPDRQTRLPTGQAIQNSKLSKEMKDSKKLTPKKREELYEILTDHPQIVWAAASVSPTVIDKINILEATKLAMQRAIKKLKVKNEKLKIDFLILDGNFKIKTKIPQKPIIKADDKVFSCMVASIIAKVTRDRLMLKYHKKYPQYGFDRHKGYPTLYHRQAVQKNGLTVIHRRSFAIKAP